jgi:hypothetical protein
LAAQFATKVAQKWPEKLLIFFFFPQGAQKNDSRQNLTARKKRFSAINLAGRRSRRVLTACKTKRNYNLFRAESGVI